MSAGAKKKMTQNLFNCVKRLLKDGASAKEIAEYLDLSTSTIWRVRDSETLEEYDNNTKVRTAQARAIAAKGRENAAEQTPQQVEHIHHHEQSVTVIANHYMAEELRKQTELLTTISNKLAYIVDDLYGTSQKQEGKA